MGSKNTNCAYFRGLLKFDSTKTVKLGELRDFDDELQEARIGIAARITDYEGVEDKSSLYSMCGVDSMEELLILQNKITIKARVVAQRYATVKLLHRDPTWRQQFADQFDANDPYHNVLPEEPNPNPNPNNANNPPNNNDEDGDGGDGDVVGV